MTAYALAHLRDVDFGDAIIDYLQKIDATLAPYGGRFIVHGGGLTPLEGDWSGDIVILEFPDRAAAQAWYASPGYQEILPLRTEHSRSTAGLLRGVPKDYRAVNKLEELMADAG